MLFLSLIILFLSLITQKWWDPVMRSLFGFCFQLFLVFVSITQFYDFWVMSYGNWTHFRCFQFQNSVFNGIFIIKHTRRDLLSEQHTWGATFDGLRRFFFFFLITEPIWSSLLFFFFFFWFFITKPIWSSPSVVTVEIVANLIVAASIHRLCRSDRRCISSGFVQVRLLLQVWSSLWVLGVEGKKKKERKKGMLDAAVGDGGDHCRGRKRWENVRKVC